MVVKSFQPGEAVSPGSSQETPRVQVARRPDNSDSPDQREPYTLDITAARYADRSAANHDRVSLNEAIESIQVALHSVSSMEQVVDGVDGLASIALSESTSERTLSVIESEGAGMLDALGEITSTATSSGVRPLSGDPIRLELERTLGPVLELCLTDERPHPLGFDKVSFASKDMILSTLAKIEGARARLKDLRSTINDGLEQLATVTEAQRTSMARQQGREAPLQVVDEALSTAWDVREQVLANPSGAESPHRVRHESAETLLNGTPNG